MSDRLLLVPAEDLKPGMVIDEPRHAGAITAIYQLILITPRGSIIDGHWKIIYVGDKVHHYRVERLVRVHPESFEY